MQFERLKIQGFKSFVDVSEFVIEPGLTSEAKQIVECTVRFSDAKPAPDVVGFGFTW